MKKLNLFHDRVDVSGVIELDLSEQSSSLSLYFFALFLLLAIYVSIVVLCMT